MTDGKLVYCLNCLKKNEKIPEEYYDSVELYLEAEAGTDEETIGFFSIVADYLMENGKHFLLLCDEDDTESNELSLTIIEKIAKEDDTIEYSLIEDDEIYEKLIEDFNNHLRFNCKGR